jgi:steroid delta-isomerase-like uncharacterized protein
MSAELIRSYFEAFNRRDVDGMLALLGDDVAHDINQGRREVGRAAFAAFLEHMNHCYQEHVVDVVILANEAQSRVGAEFEVLGTYLNTDPGFPEARGQRYRLAAGSFFEVRGGRITRVTTYYNVKAWLAQIEATG